MTPGKCLSCGAECAEFLCEPCNEKAKQFGREREEQEKLRRRLEFKAGTELRHATTLEQLPAWPWCLVGTAAFEERVDARLRRVAEHWEPTMGSLLLLGPSGAGKTAALRALVVRLATEAMTRLLGKHKSQEDFDLARTAFGEFCDGVWTSAIEIGQALRKHRLGTGDDPELVQRCLAAPWLVLDELGPEAPAVTEAIFRLVDARYTRGTPTLVTSGRTHTQLVERYGDALVRRLTQAPFGAMIDVHQGASE